MHSKTHNALNTVEHYQYIYIYIYIHIKVRGVHSKHRCTCMHFFFSPIVLAAMSGSQAEAGSAKTARKTRSHPQRFQFALGAHCRTRFGSRKDDSSSSKYRRPKPPMVTLFFIFEDKGIPQETKKPLPPEELHCASASQQLRQRHEVRRKKNCVRSSATAFEQLLCLLSWVHMHAWMWMLCKHAVSCTFYELIG